MEDNATIWPVAYTSRPAISAAQAELTLSQRTRKVERQSTRISPSSLQSSWSTDWLTTFGVAER